MKSLVPLSTPLTPPPPSAARTAPETRGGEQKLKSLEFDLEPQVHSKPSLRGNLGPRSKLFILSRRRQIFSPNQLLAFSSFIVMVNLHLQSLMTASWEEEPANSWSLVQSEGGRRGLYNQRKFCCLVWWCVGRGLLIARRDSCRKRGRQYMFRFSVSK